MRPTDALPPTSPSAGSGPGEEGPGLWARVPPSQASTPALLMVSNDGKYVPSTYHIPDTVLGASPDHPLVPWPHLEILLTPVLQMEKLWFRDTKRLAKVTGLGSGGTGI